MVGKKFRRLLLGMDLLAVADCGCLVWPGWLAHIFLFLSALPLQKVMEIVRPSYLSLAIVDDGMV